MSIIDDIRGDFASVVDGLEAVTFRRRVVSGGSETFSETENVTALRRVLDRDPGSGQTALAADSVAWHLEASDLSGINPKKGDRIKDADDVEWVIDGRATLNTFGSRWRVETHKVKA